MKMGSLSSLVSHKVSHSYRLRELFLTTITSNLFIRDKSKLIYFVTMSIVNSAK